MTKKIKWAVEFSISDIEADTEEEAIKKPRYSIWRKYGLVDAESYGDSCDMCGAEKARNFIINDEFDGLYCDSCTDDIKILKEEKQ